MAPRKKHRSLTVPAWASSRAFVLTVGTTVVALGAIWTFSGRVHDAVGRHVDRFFVSEVEAAELGAEVKAAAETATQAAEVATETSQALLRYIEGQELKEERAALERLEGEHADTVLWESQNGENELSRSRKADLEMRMEQTRERIRCLLDAEAVGC